MLVGDTLYDFQHWLFDFLLTKYFFTANRCLIARRDRIFPTFSPVSTACGNRNRGALCLGVGENQYFKL